MGALGVAIAFLYAQFLSIRHLKNRIQEKDQEILSLKLSEKALEEKVHFLSEVKTSLADTFKALSLDALQNNTRSFLDMAQANMTHFEEKTKGDWDQKQKAISDLVNPVKETLQKIDLNMKTFEKEQKTDREVMKHHLQQLIESEYRLQKETHKLVKALRSPNERGRWGEIQLKRVVELAGMINHCDFYEQNVSSQEDGLIRPDVIVKMAGGKQIIIDAKTPLNAYLEAIDLENEQEKEEKLKEHAKSVKNHINSLSKKRYWDHISTTPEFVILFLPSETFYSAALQYDPALIEIGVEQGVVIATPTTLIALLKAVAYGWKQDSLSKHAERISELGHELYKRMNDMTCHWVKMGKSLSQAVDSYNKAVGSLESRLLPTARKFKEMGAASSSLELDHLEEIDKKTRQFQEE